MPNLLQYPHDKWTIHQNKTSDDRPAAHCSPSTEATQYSPSTEATQYADYILNHYSRYSHADKLRLAIDLEFHGWKKDKSNTIKKQMNTPEQQLAESLLAACKAAGIEEPKFIAQDKSGHVYHYNVKPTLTSYEWLGVIAIRLNHQPYADDWQDSLTEWVDHIADTSKKVDDARKLGYRKMIAEYAGRRTEAQVYERAWQDALAWKGGSDD